MSDKPKIIRSFSSEDVSTFASIWKANGVLLDRLQAAVIYKAIYEIVESKRDREVIEKVAVMQNEMLEEFFKQRSKKTNKNGLD